MRLEKIMTNNKNIVFIGMMGAGKSFIASSLCDILDEFQLVDIDVEIEKETGLKISQIFEKYGEDFFRRLETKTIKNFTQRQSLIIAVGGGAFEKEENRQMLSQNGIVFYLKASAKDLFERIKTQSHRPLLDSKNPFATLKTLLKKREANYAKADFTIETGNKPAYEIVKEVIEICK